MSETTLLGLPLLESAQAQKHVTHNEALLALDLIVHLSVVNRTSTAPPSAPAEGDRYLIATGATGAWAGNSGKIAAWQAGAWHYSTAHKGWRLWVEDEQKLLAFSGTLWRDAAATDTLQNMALLGVNTTADTTNKLAVKSAAVLLDNAGSGMQIKINKNAATDTASLLYQTNYSGRAEMGLAGDDDFRIKVSANGSTWLDAIQINRTTGAVSLPHTSSSGLSDGDKGDITVSGSGAVWSIDGNVVAPSHLAQSTQNFWTSQTPTARIWRLQDRVFVGEAAQNFAGNSSAGDSGTSWLSNTANSAAFTAINSYLLVTNGTGGPYAITGASKTSLNSGTGGIGVAGVVLNDKAGGRAWSLYADIQHETGAYSSNGIEVAAKNKSTDNFTYTPYTATFGVFGVRAAAGGDASYGGASANPSNAAMIVIKNDNTWNRGIVIGADALTGQTGSAGDNSANATAIAMGRRQTITWYEPTNSGTGAEINSIVTANASRQSIEFADNATKFLGAGGVHMWRANHVASAVNYLQVTNAASGGRPVISAAGTDTDIHVQLQPKGTGGTVLQSGALGLGGLNFGTSGQFPKSQGSTSSPVWSSLASTDLSDFNEAAQDAIGLMVDASLVYVDATPLLTRAALTGDVTASQGSNATTIAAGAVTLAKQANMATASLVYRKTAGSGPPEINSLATLKTDLGLTGTNSGDQTITLTGDVTGTGSGSFAATIANNAVSNARLADMATATIKGRVTAATGDPEDLTGTQATTILDVFTSTLKGLAPASGGGTANFLRADGTWAAPAGGGGVSDGDKGDVMVSGGGTVWTIDTNAVTNAKAAQMAALTLKGNITAATANAADLTINQVRSLLNIWGQRLAAPLILV